ncbi:hypothetical protein B0H16DRAFT_1464088 [Mycena metata]|uniref:Uncharacterized protein n=1 Tax=Mycena metata TaxID=1033252 RepID=A0AAD7IHS8_9AGAR|nr:hypothetical protein B0H16DRAFT_1464088 [Mycena metata]
MCGAANAAQSALAAVGTQRKGRWSWGYRSPDGSTNWAGERWMEAREGTKEGEMKEKCDDRKGGEAVARAGRLGARTREYDNRIGAGRKKIEEWLKREKGFGGEEDTGHADRAPGFRRGVAWCGVPQWQCWRVPTWHGEAFVGTFWSPILLGRITARDDLDSLE